MTADRHVCKLTLKAFFCRACSIPLHILYISLHILYIYIYMVSYIPCLSPASQRKSCFCLLFSPTLCVCVHVCMRSEIKAWPLSYHYLHFFETVTHWLCTVSSQDLPVSTSQPCLAFYLCVGNLNSGPHTLSTEPSLSSPEWNFLKFNTFIVLSDSSRK